MKTIKELCKENKAIYNIDGRDNTEMRHNDASGWSSARWLFLLRNCDPASQSPAPALIRDSLHKTASRATAIT